MARGGKGRPSSKSALQQQEDEDARRLKETPLFSFEGLRVHRNKLLAIFAAVILVLFGLSVAIAGATSATNLEVSAAAAFGQVKAGDTATFNLTVKNTAAFSSFAYEVHLLGLPTGWSVKRGEDAFPLKPGESRDVAIALDTGASTPPNYNYPVTAKVLAKTGDLKATLASKSTTLTVHVLSSSLRLTFEARTTLGTLAAGAATQQVNFTLCGPAPDLVNFEVPYNANISSAGITVSFDHADPNATGNISADVGDDGSTELVLPLPFGPSRLTFTAPAFRNFTSIHAPLSGNYSLPVRLSTCVVTTNASAPAITAWNLTVSNPILSFQAPRAAGEPTPVDINNPNGKTGDARFLARIFNDEPRPLTLLLSVLNLPKAWDTTPSLSTTPLTVAPGASNTLDFTLRVAKTTPVGLVPINFTACVQVNPNDCVTAPAVLAQPVAPFFTVVTYVEPPTLKDAYRERPLDILLFAQNLGNAPTAFIMDLPPRIGLAVSWWDGSGDLNASVPLPLDVGQNRPFVLRVTPALSAPISTYTLTPTFRNDSQRIVQNIPFLTVSVVEDVTAPRAVELYKHISVDFVGVTESGLLFDTDIFSMVPLINEGRRPTHPEYEKPNATGLPAYNFMREPDANYSGVVHKGFEPWLDGLYERETRVLWLTGNDTKYPQTAFLFGQTVVFEVRIAGIADV